MHLFIEFRLLGHVALKNIAVQLKILVSTKNWWPVSTPCTALRWVKDLRDLSYEERLRELKLQSLEKKKDKKGLGADS